VICAIVLAAGESRRMGSQKLLLPFGAKTVVAHIVDQLLPSVVDKVIVVTGHESGKVAEALSTCIRKSDDVCPPSPLLKGEPQSNPPLKGGRGDVGYPQRTNVGQEKTSPLPPFKGGFTCGGPFKGGFTCGGPFKGGFDLARPRMPLKGGNASSNLRTERLGCSSVVLVENPQYATGMLSSVRCGIRALPPGCHAAMVCLGDQPSVTTDLVNDLVHAFKGGDKGIVVPVFEGKRGHPILFSERYYGEVLTRFDDAGLRGLLHAYRDDVFELAAATPAVLSDMDYPEDYRREIAASESDLAGERGSYE